MWSQAEAGILTFNQVVTADAPGAKALKVGEVNVAEDTQMLVRLQSDDSVVATYDGYTVEDFARIAETGSAEGVGPSLMDSFFDDLFDRLEGILSGNKPTDEKEEKPGYDPKVLVDLEQLEAKIAELLEAGRLESDCLTCADRGEVCVGYQVKRSEDGRGYLCTACGHTPGVHSSTVLMEMADIVAGAVMCSNGGVHTWGEDHVCKVCGMEYLFKDHIYVEMDESGVTDPFCKVCGLMDPEKACAAGLHLYNMMGVCENCGQRPEETGEACPCTDGDMAGLYCAKCGHSIWEHEFEGDGFGACNHNH